MARKHPIRYLSAFLLAATGGIASQVSAEALGAHGPAAIGLFAACIAIFCLPATALTVGLDSRGEGSPEPVTRAKR